MEKSEIIEKCRTWVERFVIGLQLCPFAKHPFDKGQIRFEVCFEKNMEAQLIAFWREVELLSKTPATEISNSLLIFPSGLDDFGKYLDLLDLAERLLADQGQDDTLQLASFHPAYQFEGTEKKDVTNFTNRSPFPMIHLLRTEEVAAAIAGHPNIEQVPLRNIEKLRELGMEGIQKILGQPTS